MKFSSAARTARKTGKAVRFTYQNRTVTVLPNARTIWCTGVSLDKR